MFQNLSRLITTYILLIIQLNLSELKQNRVTYQARVYLDMVQNWMYQIKNFFFFYPIPLYVYSYNISEFKS